MKPSDKKSRVDGNHQHFKYCKRAWSSDGDCSCRRTNEVKKAMKPKKKKPRVWKAWGVTCSEECPSITKNRLFARILCKAWKSAFPSTRVVRVTITERKP